MFLTLAKGIFGYDALSELEDRQGSRATMGKSPFAVSKSNNARDDGRSGRRKKDLRLLLRAK